MGREDGPKRIQARTRAEAPAETPEGVEGAEKDLEEVQKPTPRKPRGKKTGD